MAIDTECVGYARDCARLAQKTNDPDLRERLLQMAREWMAVAMREDNLPVRYPRPRRSARALRKIGLAPAP